MNEPEHSIAPLPRPPEIAGKWIVIAVFAFAILMTGAMWVYWRLHIGPFLPLQRAIVAEWPDSAPRVEGGQRKMHQGTPRILRATLKVPFDPTDESRKAELKRRVARIRELAAGTLDLARYDRLEVHFFHPVPEQEIRTRPFEEPLRKAPE
ncbi:MAG: hypothetical protein WD069_15735 [Planctomycetales bacterium]